MEAQADGRQPRAARRGERGPVSLTRRDFLLRTGSLGAAATVAMYPSVARAAGLADPLIDEVAAPALKLLARDTVSGLIVFEVPGSDRYSQAQGVTSTRPGGIDAKAQDLLLIDLDEFLPIPETYAQALAAALSTGVSDIPLPPDALGPLTGIGEQLTAQVDDALRSLLQSDSTVPLSLVIALILNASATLVNPASVAGPILGSPFASLKFAEKASVMEQIETADAQLVALLDGNLPQPLKDSLSGLLRFVGGALQEFAAFTSYTEFGVFDRATGTATSRPVGWDLAAYMPGRTVPVDGWDEFRGYFQGRTSTATDPGIAGVPAAGSGGGGAAVGGGAAAGGAIGPAARKPARRKRRRKRKRKAGR